MTSLIERQRSRSAAAVESRGGAPRVRGRKSLEGQKIRASLLGSDINDCFKTGIGVSLTRRREGGSLINTVWNYSGNRVSERNNLASGGGADGLAAPGDDKCYVKTEQIKSLT